MKNVLNEISKNHPSIKFDQKHSKSKMKFLDFFVHKDEQQRLQTTLSKKKKDIQTYLHAKSDYPASLKKIITHSEILHVKRICSTNREFKRN